MVDPVKNYSHIYFDHYKNNLVVVSNAVWAHVGGPKNSGNAGAPPLGTGGWLTPWKHTCPPPVLPCQLWSF